MWGGERTRLRAAFFLRAVSVSASPATAARLTESGSAPPAAGRASRAASVAASRCASRFSSPWCQARGAQGKGRGREKGREEEIARDAIAIALCTPHLAREKELRSIMLSGVG